jgi:perosamine synthetase
MIAVARGVRRKGESRLPRRAYGVRRVRSAGKPDFSGYGADHMIPIAQPMIGQEEIDAVREVIASGMLARGSYVDQFEHEFAQYCGTEYAVAMNSGTAALFSTLYALDIAQGDEVIVPDFTFIATASSVRMAGAHPVFADINEKSYNIQPEAILEHITPKTRAVIGVHLYGQPFDVRAVSEICEDHGLILIEDCAQAHGARYEGRKVGGFGTAGCFSFYPTKNMTTSEGGMVTTDDPHLAMKLRKIIDHGQDIKYRHDLIGFNFRMTNLEAAIGRVQLGKLDAMNERRRMNAAYLLRHLPASGIIAPYCAPQSRHVYHQFVIRLEENLGVSQEDFMGIMRERGIQTAIHYPIPLHRQPVFAQAANGTRCPVSESCACSVLSLPVHPSVSKQDCRYICTRIREVI